MNTWQEIQPILGPLIQAATVLAVGGFTIWFQLRQARTAERKLFTDLHEKRYKALTSFEQAVINELNRITDTNDNDGEPQDIMDQGVWLEINSRLTEVAWLFGDDVSHQASMMYWKAEEAVIVVRRLRLKLREDDPVDLVDRLNIARDNVFQAQGTMADAARRYLYMGDIHRKVEPEIVRRVDEYLSSR